MRTSKLIGLVMLGMSVMALDALACGHSAPRSEPRPGRGRSHGRSHARSCGSRNHGCSRGPAWGMVFSTGMPVGEPRPYIPAPAQPSILGVGGTVYNVDGGGGTWVACADGIPSSENQADKIKQRKELKKRLEKKQEELKSKLKKMRDEFEKSKEGAKAKKKNAEEEKKREKKFRELIEEKMKRTKENCCGLGERQELEWWFYQETLKLKEETDKKKEKNTEDEMKKKAPKKYKKYGESKKELKQVEDELKKLEEPAPGEVQP